MKCAPQSGGKSLEAASDKLELGMRLLLALVFCGVFAGIGYTVGSLMWTGLGVIIALFLMPVGALYGFFCDYVNALIKWW